VPKPPDSVPVVIDTTNFVDEHHWVHGRAAIPASDALRAIERTRMQNVGKKLEIEYTLTDPKVFIGEWKFDKHWDRVDAIIAASIAGGKQLEDRLMQIFRLGGAVAIELCSADCGSTLSRRL
jgi:hypothetical protein